MKAIQYAETFKRSSDKPGALARVLIEMYRETCALVESRKIKGGAAFAAAFNETNQKFAAFCRHVGLEAHADTFEWYVKKDHAEVYRLWKEVNAAIERRATRHQ